MASPRRRKSALPWLLAGALFAGGVLAGVIGLMVLGPPKAPPTPNPPAPEEPVVRVAPPGQADGEEPPVLGEPDPNPPKRDEGKLVAQPPAEEKAPPPVRDAGRAPSYVSDMRRAFRAAQDSDYARVRELLARHRPVPGGPDPRAWEWYHLRALCREPVLSFRHPSATHDAVLAWSPDAKRLASGGSDGTVLVWDLAAEKEAFPITVRKSEAILGLAWRPDGKRLTSVDRDGTLRGWDTASGKELFAVGRRGHPLRAVEWSVDRQRLLGLAQDGTVRVCDAATGKEKFAVRAHAWVHAAAWSPDGRRFVSTGKPDPEDARALGASAVALVGSPLGLGPVLAASALLPGRTQPWSVASDVKVWDAGTGKLLWARRGHRVPVRALAWSPDGKRFASADEGGTIRLWDATAGKETKSLEAGKPQDGLYRLAWDAKGKRLSLATPAGVSAWDADTGAPLAAADIFDPDARYLVTQDIHGGQDVELRVSETQTGKVIASFLAFAWPESLARLRGGLPVAFSPDGRRVAAAGSKGTVKVCNMPREVERVLPVGQAGAYAWAPDSRRVVLLDQDMAVKSWDVRTGKQTIHMPGQAESHLRLTAWSPDGRRLLVCYRDGSLKVWNLTRSKEPLVLAQGDTAGTGKGLSSALWSPDGKRLIGLGDRAIRGWDAVTGRPLFAFGVPWLTGGLLAWAPNGKRLALATNPFGPIQVVEVATGKRPLEIQFHPGDGVAFSPDGKRLAACGRVGENVKVWEADTGEEVLSVPMRGGPLAWSPDGKRLAVTQTGEGFKVLEVATGNELLAVRAQTGGSTPTWSPDGKRLAMLDRVRDKVVVKAWDADTGDEAFTLFRGGGPMGTPGTSLSWSPDGRYIAASNVVWDVATRKVIRHPNPSGDKVCWDRSGPRLVSIKGNEKTGTWVATSGKESRVIARTWWAPRDQPIPYTAFAWARDARRLAFSRFDGHDSRFDGFDVWDVARARKTLAVIKQPGPFVTLAWDPQGRRLATATPDGTLTVWEAAGGRALLKVPGRVKGHGSGFFPLAWSPDGKYLASASQGGRGMVREARTGKIVRTLRRHEGELTALAWSPDGKRLASGSDDWTVKLWDTRSGKEVVTLRGHRGTVRSLAWSPDGKRLASVGAVAGQPGDLTLWDAATGEEITTWPHQAGPVTWSPDGRCLASVAGGTNWTAITVCDSAR